MLTVFAIMSTGIAVGFILRRFPDLRIIDRLVTVFIFLLLLFLGIAVGGNRRILENLGGIGVQAVVVTAGALTGSVAAAWYVYRRFGRKR